MDLSEQNKSKLTIRRDKNINAIYHAKYSNYEKIVQGRPLTFSLYFSKNIPKDFFSSINYDTKKIGKKFRIGVKRYLNLLELSLDKLKKIISIPNIKDNSLRMK